MAANIQGSITNPKVGQNVANYAQGLRQFIPAFQNCPSRTIRGHEQFAIDTFSRIAPNKSVQQVGWCGGQFDPQYLMANEVAVSRPQYIMNQGSINGDLSVASDGLPRSVYGQGAAVAKSNVEVRTDTLTLGGMKNSATRYDGLTAPNGGFLALYDNPIATATSGAESRVCLGELAFAKAAKAEQASINLDSKYASAPAFNLEFGAPDSQAYASAFQAYLPKRNEVVIP